MKGWILALLLGVLTCATATAADLAPSPVSRGADAADAPAALLATFARLATACGGGDRQALTKLLPPDAASRARHEALVTQLLSRPDRPLAGPRVEVLTAVRDGAEWSGSALLFARIPVAPAKPGDDPPPPLTPGFARPEPGDAVMSLLYRASADGALRELTEGFPSTVTFAHVELALEPSAREARARVRLELSPPGRVALLSLPEDADVRAIEGAVTASSGFDGGSLARVECAAPGVVALESRTIVAKGDVKDGAMALLAHEQVVPFARGGHFRFECLIDVPLPLRSLCIGAPEDLAAPPGRRVTRWTCDRAVDYLPVAAADFDIVRSGEGAETLELWRTRQVGGDAQRILASLREIVSFQERHVAPLPYRAFRLVELPTMEGLAVSYPSVIFMTPGMLAREQYRNEILSHEIGHQWWGNAVSPHPTARWAAEGMADAMRDLFVLQRDGLDAYRDRLDRHRTRTLGSIGPMARPLADNPGGGDAYDRGALFAHALREQLGDETFWRVLRRWYERLAPLQPRTADYQREAETVAQRPLGEVFDPWLRSTAMPVVQLQWQAEGARVRLTLTQEEPAFPLAVPLRAVRGELREDLVVPMNGASVTVERDLPFEPEDVRLDPDKLLPRVHQDELQRYHRAEAAACLARGDARRARALLQREKATSLLPLGDELALFAARVADGVAPESARADLDVALAELPTRTERWSAMMSAADALVHQGAPAAALPLLEALDADVTEGAEVPRRLGLALRALGREEDALAALRRALQRNPADAATRAALGMAAAAATAGHGIALEPVLAEGHAALKASAPERTEALPLPGGRVALLLGGARALLVGAPPDPAPVPSYSPTGAVGMAALGSRLVVLESQRLRSTLTVIDVRADAAAAVVARHVRAPGGAKAIVAREDDVLVAWPAREGWEWRRFVPPLGRPTEGPDDDDGLKRIAVADDARFESVAASPAPASGAGSCCAWAGDGIAVIAEDRRRVVSGEATAWEELHEGSRVLSVRGSGGAMSLVIARSPSAFGADATASARLVVLEGDALAEVPLPGDAVDAAALGDVVVVERATDDGPLIEHGRRP